MSDGNSEAWRICAVIPARNEERLIERCLQSVLNARQIVERPDEVDVVVVCDLCTDDTEVIARKYLQSAGVVVACHAGLVGESRRMGVSTALNRQSNNGGHKIWIANTDADCEVPELWLVDQLSFARNGVDAVAGIVDVDSFEDHEPRVRTRFRSTYLVDANGQHPHVHGANLGLSASAYQTAGGWSSLATGEDHDLWHRLKMARLRIESSSRLRVVTSGRRIGRAPAGFADALAAHNENAA